jgi:hypothetical protein
MGYWLLKQLVVSSGVIEIIVILNDVETLHATSLQGIYILIYTLILFDT